MKKILLIMFLFFASSINAQLCKEYPCVIMGPDSVPYIVVTLEQANKAVDYIDSYYILDDLLELYKEDSIVYVNIIDEKDKKIESYKINIEIYKKIISNLEKEIDHLISMKSVLEQIDKKQADRISRLERNQNWLKLLSGGLAVLVILVII